MTVEEIKSQYSMRSIVERYGIKVNRTGFCSCPFHGQDKHPSMKIYKDSYNCFTCGANGDIFSFIQNMEHCDFKTAFYQLGGTYAKPTFESNLAIYRAKKAKQKAELEKKKLLNKRELNNFFIKVNRKGLLSSEPLSDDWCFFYNELQYQIYIDECINNELKTR